MREPQGNRVREFFTLIAGDILYRLVCDQVLRLGLFEIVSLTKFFGEVGERCQSIECSWAQHLRKRQTPTMSSNFDMLDVDRLN